MKPARPSVRIGIDTGGTFTDFLVAWGRETLVFKVPSTPEDPARAFHQGLAIAARRLLAAGVDVAATRPWDVAHGFTVATNALLSRRGARIALVTTKGFEDVLAIGRQHRPELYALAPAAPMPLVERRAIVGAVERTGPRGETLTRLTPGETARVVRAVARLRPEAVAVGFLHAYANSAHERRMRAALVRALPGVPVSLSSEVAAVHREVERLSTTTADAYVAPLVTRYLARLARPRAHVLRIMQSNGGAAPARDAARAPVTTVLSGPAGGVLGARRLGKAAGIEMLLTLDIGGTSTDVALVPGRLLATRETEIAGVPLAVPILDVHTVGAGGGSIARVDAGGALVVGPQSAGADPGPACYGKGGPATVTDAMVVLGRIVPAQFLGGAMALDPAAAQRALAALGRELGTDALGAARGVVLVANATIERALRAISVERGHDVRQAALVAFGGAGPLSACELAAALGAREVVVPPAAGILSAWGLLGADALHSVAATLLVRVERARPWPRARLAATISSLAGELERRHGKGAGRRAVTLGLRYQGQSFELRLPVGTPRSAVRDARAAFDRVHRERFGYARPDAPIEIVEVELELRRPGPALPAFAVPRRTGAGAAIGRHAVAALEQGPRRPTPVWQRAALGRDFRGRGPLLVIEYGATTFVPPGWTVALDPRGNLRLLRGGR
ncbi:MAG: hydantoinase/oxoprolinase family protein [Candidatus Eisenbacteria bacterium]